ncbi:hypothetical protein BGP_4100 [Beggiatoa sp. PS]|nr:hypothetical protein BGP_4100 [Beggiatoa sp. PS]
MTELKPNHPIVKILNCLNQNFQNLRIDRMKSTHFGGFNAENSKIMEILIQTKNPATPLKAAYRVMGVARCYPTFAIEFSKDFLFLNRAD